MAEDERAERGTREHAARRDRRSERHVATRREIVDVAWRLAREHGLGGWSLRDVAQAVGMRAPSLYVYFDSKNAVYDAMFADGYQALLERADEAPDDLSGVEALDAAARVFFRFCVEDPARHQLLFLRTLPGFEPSQASYALAQRALERLSDLLTDAGLGDPESLDLWTAVVTGLATQQVSNDPGGERWARLLPRAVEMMTAGKVRTRTAPGRTADARR